MTWHVIPSCVYAVTLACPQNAGLAAHTQLSVQCMHSQFRYIRLGIQAVDGICHHSSVWKIPSTIVALTTDLVLEFQMLTGVRCLICV